MLKKRLYALLAVTGIIVGSAGVFSQNSAEAAIDTLSLAFTDVSPEKWYYPYVSYLTDTGIVNGMTNTEFVPEGTFTVAEASAVITRYLGLESEAQRRKEAMEMLGISGSNLWYAGYVQLMHEAGIIDVEAYGCSVNGGSISIDNSAFLHAPVKRYEFAAFVTRSFELGQTQIRTSSGTDGSDFIHNGSYDDDVLSAIIPLIKDYSLIPYGYEECILKSYYNGIFNGDDLGNFNPHKNLTRAEMAKVITVIIDKSQRSFAYSESDNLSDVQIREYSLSDDSFIERRGIKYLKPEVSDSIILGEILGCLSLNYGNNTTVSYSPSNYYPEGYVISLRHYRQKYYNFTEELDVVFSDNTYTNSFVAGDVLLFVLSDLNTGEAVDAYEIKLNSFGLTENNSCNYLP